MRSTIFVLSIFGAILTFNGAVSNWWSSRFPSAYLAAQKQLAISFAAAFAVFVMLAVWSRLTGKKS